ncbi:MAG: DNA primase DnaG [Candidatus Woesearchaeota archaeon]
MGKIAPVSSKYIIHASIEIDGIVDRPDVIGAIFGQTEGLLGADLELRELQRSGRIGRIEVNVDTKSGKSNGQIIIPSSLDKAETSIIGAALEIIQRIGPCNAKIKVQNIEDVRVSKRNYVIDRAKNLLRTMMDDIMPDSQDIADEVAYSVRVMEITEYGNEKLPAGPAIDDSEEILVVEGRADVVNLLKHGIKNAIAMNGTSVPKTIGELSRKKTIIAFLDGDRGGNLILRELIQVAELDFVCYAPDGKEVEEITKKEIHKALRSKIAAEQAKLDLSREQEEDQKKHHNKRFNKNKPQHNTQHNNNNKHKLRLNNNERAKFKELLEDLIGTRGAYILDDKLTILGKVPISELGTTIKSLQSGIHAVILDGVVDKDLISTSERANIKYIIAMDSQVKGQKTTILVSNQL